MQTFQIKFTKRVVFRDMNQNVQKVYEIGDTCNATHDTGAYFVTAMGGIWHDEAVRIA